MKTLEELNELLTDLPCPFASYADDWEEGRGSDFPMTARDAPCTNYETGIPQLYAQDKDAQDVQERGALIPRQDFNRLGNLATRELFLRRCGVWHTFDSDFSAENLGYAAGAVLVYDDKKWLRFVESQENDNDLDFTKNPIVIDNLATKPSDSANASPRVLWKTTNRIYGLAEGLVHVGVDFSRRHDLTGSTNLEDDSLVFVGASAWGSGYYGHAVLTEEFNEAVAASTCGDFQVDVTVGNETLQFPCKSLQGGGFNFWVWFVHMFPSLGERVYYGRLCGGANFPIAFFTSADDANVAATAYGNNNPLPNAVSVVAYPIETAVAQGGA